MPELNPIRLFLVCPGLGRVNRGFESFTAECFQALRGSDRLALKLYKGAGEAGAQERALHPLSRSSRTAAIIGRILGRSPYAIEQASFMLHLLPALISQRPDVIYFSDATLGNLLWHWRKLTGARYRLLFSNGGPYSPPFPRFDHIQQIAPAHFEAGCINGVPVERQTLLPYGIALPATPALPNSEQRKALRAKLNLPCDRQLVLCVGAINRAHKRTDYVISEIASIPRERRPYLLLLGERDSEAATIERQSLEQLGAEGVSVRTVSAEQVSSYYQAADLFTMASLHEGFGRVFLEALSWGLPCLAHDYPVSRYVLGEEGAYSDFTKIAALATLIETQLKVPWSDTAAVRRFARVRKNFGWDRLAPQYVELIERCFNFKMVGDQCPVLAR